MVRLYFIPFFHRRPYKFSYLCFLQRWLNVAQSLRRVVFRHCLFFRVKLQSTISHIPFSNESFRTVSLFERESCAKCWNVLNARNTLFTAGFPGSRAKSLTILAGHEQEILISNIALSHSIRNASIWNGILVLSRNGELVACVIWKLGDGTAFIFWCRGSNNYISLIFRFEVDSIVTTK